MAGVLSKTEAPPFDIMGLLLGGRGYASSWFQNRDKLRILDIAQAKELSDRQAYTKGVLASPELTAQIQNPYDRRANWNLWGQLVGGPESMVPFGNQMQVQSSGAIYDKEQSILSNQLSAANIKLTADEQLRVDLTTRQRDAFQQDQLMKRLFEPDESGATPAQNQFRRDLMGDKLGFKRQEGYSFAEGANGFEPTIGGKVFNEMMAEGQAFSNMINSAEYLQNMIKTGQGDKDQWAAIRASMMLEMKKAETMGALDAGVSDFFAKVVPDYYPGYTGTDLSNQLADKLAVDIKLWKNKLAQVGDKYRVPIEGFSQRKALGAEPADDAALMERFPAGNPVATPAPAPDNAWTGSPGAGYQ